MTVAMEGDAAPRCFVYILGSRRDRDCRTYVGWTLDLERRLAQHNGGSGAKSTRGRDWRLLYAECCATRSAAMSREWHLKRARKLRQELRATLLEERDVEPHNALRDERASRPAARARNSSAAPPR